MAVAGPALLDPAFEQRSTAREVAASGVEHRTAAGRIGKQRRRRRHLRGVGLPALERGRPLAACRAAGVTGASAWKAASGVGDGAQVLAHVDARDHERGEAPSGREAVHDDERFAYVAAGIDELTDAEIRLGGEPAVEGDLASHARRRAATVEKSTKANATGFLSL